MRKLKTLIQHETSYGHCSANSCFSLLQGLSTPCMYALFIILPLEKRGGEKKETACPQPWKRISICGVLGNIDIALQDKQKGEMPNITRSLDSCNNLDHSPCMGWFLRLCLIISLRSVSAMDSPDLVCSCHSLIGMCPCKPALLLSGCTRASLESRIKSELLIYTHASCIYMSMTLILQYRIPHTLSRPMFLRSLQGLSHLQSLEPSSFSLVLTPVRYSVKHGVSMTHSTFSHG